VKIAIKRQEEEVRKKTAEALAMKAQWKQAQIQNSIAKALEGLTFENQFESFGAAAERIKDAQAEAGARQEMMGESIQGKIMAMEDKSMDYEAEEQLQQLEQKLGMRAAPETPAATTDAAAQPVTVAGADAAAAPAAPAVPASEVDQQLAELEKRLQSDGSKN
jgi:phage shock protein A